MRTRKYKKPRSPRKVFLVICEGETEETYVNALKKHYRLPVAIKTKVSGNAINLRMVNQYVQELGIEVSDDYRIFYVYDSDIQSVVEKLQKLPGEVILTNPCIELWYLLHVKDYTRCQNSKTLLKDLSNSHKAWDPYSKGILTNDQLNILLSNSQIAVSRSKKLKWPFNPSSNMHVFIEALESEKNAEVTQKSPSEC